MGSSKVLDKVAVAKLAAALLRKGTPLADAIRETEAKANRPAASIVAAVYWRAEGEASPIRGTGRTLAKRVAARRATGVRWEVLAYAVAAGTGRRYSVREAKALAVAGGTNLETSYAGRGTREGARGSRPLAATVAVAKARTAPAPADPAKVAAAILASPSARAAILAALAAESKDAAPASTAPDAAPAESKDAAPAESVAARTRAAREANAKALAAKATDAAPAPVAAPKARRSARRSARKAS